MSNVLLNKPLNTTNFKTIVYLHILQDTNLKQKRLQYERANLQTAYTAVFEKGMSVYKAARAYDVPESTLRDRIRGNVEVDAKVGHDTIFSHDEEQELVGHLSYMASIGYGYSKADIQVIGKEYATALGKKVFVKPEESCQLSNNWFYRFLSRWEELKFVKPQKLSIARAKNASPDNLKKYFKELATILTTNKLHDKPNRIFNIDETGITTDHSPPKIVCKKDTKPQSITSERNSTITVIAGGNALGNFVPPYYVFPGKRWKDDFLLGAAYGSAGEMSESGWSNMNIFHNYITKHFARHTGITANNKEPILILYDGHRSHISLTLADWAKNRSVILFVLPPHSSHLTQPLDVGVFGPFKNIYNIECKSFLQKNPGLKITKYDVASLSSRPYLKAMSPDNLVSSFRKTGIFPYNNKAILPDETAPSIIYTAQEIPNVHVATEELTQNHETLNSSVSNDVPVHETPITENHNSNETQTEENQKENEELEVTTTSTKSSFFQSKTIKSAIVKKPKRKFVPPYLAGSLGKTSIVAILQKCKTSSTCKKSKLDESSVPCHQKKPTKTHVKRKTKVKSIEPRPSTSGTSTKGGPITLSEDTNTDSDVDYTDDEEVCCVCDKWQPNQLKEFSRHCLC